MKYALSLHREPRASVRSKRSTYSNGNYILLTRRTSLFLSSPSNGVRYTRLKKRKKNEKRGRKRKWWPYPPPPPLRSFTWQWTRANNLYNSVALIPRTVCRATSVTRPKGCRDIKRCFQPASKNAATRLVADINCDDYILILKPALQ